MNKNFYLITLLIFCFHHASAQQAQRIFKGRVTDSASTNPIGDATITIYRASDTSLLNFGFTTPMGNFSITAKSNDSLLIIISIVGYKEKEFTSRPNMDWSFTDFGDIKLAPIPQSFKGFTVRTSAIRMKGDTIEINANRFKVLPGSDVAQLFKKIPGFEVNVKGEIKVNGSEVTKIMVDGSDFFGNNPGLVSKNLNADMVETVQVFDDKNEDGSLKQGGSKTINLKLKKGKRNGTFGDVLAGYGTDSRYETGLRLNNFKNDRKFSFIVNAQNNNQTGFDFGFSNWHNSQSFDKNGGGSDDDWIVNSYEYSDEGNINNKISSGLTYFNEFKHKQKFSFNAFASRNHYTSINSSNSMFALNDSTRRYSNDSSNTDGISMNYSLGSAYTKTIDSTGTFEMGLSGGLSQNNVNTDGFNNININSNIVNLGFSNKLFKGLSGNGNAHATYRRSLRKDKRYTFFLHGNYKYNSNNGDNYQFQNNSNDTFNIVNSNTKNSQEILIKTYLKIPLYKKIWYANVSFDMWQNNNTSAQDLLTANNPFVNNFTQEYNGKIDTLSLSFKNKLVQYTAKPYISYERNKVYMTSGATFMNFNLSNTNADNGITLDRSYNKFLPYYTVSYYPSFMYLYGNIMTSTQFPNILELQPVLNINNNFERTIGNEKLNPQDNLGFRVYANFYKIKGFRYLYSSFQGNMSNNAKIWSSSQNENGIIIRQPINASGQRDFNGYIGTSKKLWKIIHLGASISAYGDRTPLMVNSISSFSNNTNLSFRPYLEFTKSDSLELSVSYSINNVNYSNLLNENLNFKQNTFEYGLNIRTVLKWGTSINTHLEISDRRNVPNIGKVIPIWSAFIQQPIGKSKYSIKLTAYDILKKNTSIDRSANENFIYISRSNRIQQYFMLTLIYNLKKMGGDDAERQYVY